MKHLTAEQIAELRAHLEERLNKLVSYREGVREENPINSPDHLENKESGDEAYEAYEVLESESLNTASTDIIREVRAALKRMDEGTYGVDEKTGEPIAFERLLLVPETRTLAPDERA